MNDLKKLIGRGNIVERYEGVYAFPAKLRNQPMFLEDRLAVWVDERYTTDLLESMTEQAQRTSQLQIVEEYKYSRGTYQDNGQCRKLIASSSSELDVIDRPDSSMECEKVATSKGYDTDNRSQRSDFSRKESVEEVQVPLEVVGGNIADMEIEEAPEQLSVAMEDERPTTPPKNRAERYPVRSSARKETKQRAEKIAQLKSVGCNCKKSHCLKMYCECFHLQVFCGQNCSCKGCGNMERSHQQQQAIIEALSRNPRAFDDDNPEKGCFQLGVDLDDVKKGCKCKKTKCLKKYCECFNSGTPCSVFCKCDGCENMQ